jgi:hypothetical protein
MVSCHTADSKPVKQEVNCTVIFPPLVFLVQALITIIMYNHHLHHNMFIVQATESSNLDMDGRLLKLTRFIKE